MAGKEAVVFIFDANYTMNASYPEESIWDPLVSSPPKEAPSTSFDHGEDSTILSKSNSIARSFQTRLSAGKEAILEFVVNLSWRSRQSEIGIVVLKTRGTHHHLYQSDFVDANDGTSLGQLFFECDDSFCNEESIKINQDNNLEFPSIPFPNLIELVPCGGISRPNAQLLSDITRIQSTILSPVEKCNNHSKKVVNSIQGDFCDGLILAADALYRRTRGKKFTRRIIMITDAEHEVHIDGEQLECVLGGLKKMDCSLGVVGIGFENGGEFGKSFDGTFPRSDNADNTFEDNFEQYANLDGDNAVSTIDIDEVSDNKNSCKNDIKNPRQNNDNNSISDPELFVKRENEKLLISLAQQTGGWVAPANGECLTTILLNHPSSARGGAKSRRTKAEFRIAPNLTVGVRTMYMTSSSKFPSLNKEIYQLDPESGKPLRDGLGEYLTYNIRRRTTHYDAEQPDVVVENITNAYPYGCDLIPVGKMDMLGIKAAFSSPACIEMLGYIAVSDVPIHLLIGPASAVVGGKESNKSRVTVASIAQAMEEKGVYGLCRFVKTDDAEPVLGVLIPKTDDDNDKDGCFGADSFLKHDVGKYLIVMQLPFAEDVQDIPPSKVPADIYGDNNEATACDELIDSLILPDDEFRSTDISTPSIKCFERMVASNAMIPPVYDEEDLQKGQLMESILEASKSVPLCNFDAIKSLHERAAVKAEAFFHAFPLKKMASLNGNDVNHTKKYWGDEN